MLHFFVSVVFLCTTMMFNGLMVYGDSDTSDFTKESLGASSEAGSAVSAGSDERARSLESKLMATLQVLKNKEETVRVQAESLALAEARIAALTARRRFGTHRAEQTELHSTRTSADGCCVETTDVTAQTQDVDHNMVSKLQDNLSIIEELYRECFYETVKQEEVIERLRKSYLDVRLTRRAPARCQDIALEVDNLKSEISDFLNSSNHDSVLRLR